MDFSLIGIGIGAFFGAGFGIGGNLIFNYLVSGRVTPEHLQKSDLTKLEKVVGDHIEKHTQCEKTFLTAERFEKHVDCCPIHTISSDFFAHRLKHGEVDPLVQARVSSLENKVTEFYPVFEKLFDVFHAVDKKLDLVVQRIDYYFDKQLNVKVWDGKDRRSNK